MLIKQHNAEKSAAEIVEKSAAGISSWRWKPALSVTTSIITEREPMI